MILPDTLQMQKSPSGPTGSFADAWAANQQLAAELQQVAAEIADKAPQLKERLNAAQQTIIHARRASAELSRQEFLRLADAWRNECGTSSNMVKIHLQPSYQRIIGLGPDVLPFIFGEMKRSPDFWFWALRSITGENPVPSDHAGDLLAMTQDWLTWAEKKGFTVADAH